MNPDATNSEKISTGLALSLDTTAFDTDRKYTIIFRFSGDIVSMQKQISFPFVILLNQFAVGTATRTEIFHLARLSSILYIDITRQLEYEQAVSPADRIATCFPMFNAADQLLQGKGVLIGIVDSGIDLYHPAFIRENGISRVVAYWDQTVRESSQSAYGFGTVYSARQINTLINQGRSEILFDSNGHGTAVASIPAALSPAADIVGVRTLPNTAAFLCSVDFIARYAIEEQLPLVLNLSYGNNYGAHDGTSMPELYLDALRSNGKFSIVTGMGNEGNTGRHHRIEATALKNTGFFFGVGLRTCSLQLWSAPSTSYIFRFFSPSGAPSMYFNSENVGASYSFLLGNTEISLQIGYSSPYSQKKEIFIEFRGSPIDDGYWTLETSPVLFEFYRIDAWFPVASSTSANVEFEIPAYDLTLTIPASSQTAISVGAYNQTFLNVASFSGRGSSELQKPDFIAPGVNIIVANAGGGYTMQTGTSFAVPFVSAAVANLMQWGITDGNDPFLYGERAKAYLQNGANPLPGSTQIPNPSEGWGRLCANGSIPN